MLDIDLVHGRPALQVEYRISLAADLLQALYLVVDAPRIEGLDQWVYATHAVLPPTLKSDIQVALSLIQKSHLFSSWLYKLSSRHPVHHDFAAFIGWLNALSQQDFQNVIDDALGNLCCPEDGIQLSEPYAQDTEGLRAMFGQKLEGAQLERLLQLVANPLELKSQLVSVLTRFWEQFYCQEFQRCLPLMQHSVEYHRRQDYRGDFAVVFTVVTGRRLPTDHRDYEDVERVIFVPSCHIGPYVILNDLPEMDSVVMLHFNCRPTGAPEREKASVVQVQDLFPPLKALADETRLQILSILDGQELYAQEIVDQLDISQSAVSRHLRLMVTGGLLNVRKEESMKYYSINEETLVGLAERLRQFRGI